MVKRRDLIRWLKRHGCSKLREGGEHSVWLNPATGARRPVPRHREIPAATVRSICDGLGIPSL